MDIDPSIDILKASFTVPVAPDLNLDRFVYCYIIYGETITLIDTGVAGCETRIYDAIRSKGRDPSEIAWVILTHSHPDHIGAAFTIQQQTGCKIAAHAAEQTWIEHVGLQNKERPVPGFATLVSGSVQINRLLADGDLIEIHEIGDMNMTVLHTPGHSPGSISLFMEQKGLLFTGDAVPVTGDLPVYDDARASMESIHRLRELASIRMLLSAWDEPREGSKAYEQIDQGAIYLQNIHEAVNSEYGKGTTDLMDLTRNTAKYLGLPPQAVNPLLARTFAANLRLIERDNLP